MTNARPTVSVVMATYNGAAFIREQIDSILNQTYPISELIIQDDCSTDSTPAICREYEEKYPIVHFYENEHNLGFNDNFRTAAMRATGDFIAISDQDDVWFPKKIEKQVAAIGNHDICTCIICRGENQETARIEPDSDDIRPGTHIFRCLLGHSILGNGMFMRNPQNWEGALNYDWNLTLHADWNNGIVRIGEVLLFHRAHNASITHKTVAMTEASSKSAPYLHGYKIFRLLQQQPKFTSHCRYIFEHTKDTKDGSMELQHKFASLLLGHSFTNYIRLCLFCMRNRKAIYFPANKAKGLLGIERGFFFPAFAAYYTSFNFL
jgi:glycosyltransferase involved in cell wall biosynthesis